MVHSVINFFTKVFGSGGDEGGVKNVFELIFETAIPMLKIPDGSEWSRAWKVYQLS